MTEVDGGVLAMERAAGEEHGTVRDLRNEDHAMGKARRSRVHAMAKAV